MTMTGSVALMKMNSHKKILILKSTMTPMRLPVLRKLRNRYKLKGKMKQKLIL